MSMLAFSDSPSGHERPEKGLRSAITPREVDESPVQTTKVVFHSAKSYQPRGISPSCAPAPGLTWYVKLKKADIA